MQIRDACDEYLRTEVTRREEPVAWGAPLNDAEWDDLVREGHIRSIAANRRLVDEVCQRLLRARRRHNPFARAPRQRGPSADRVDARQRRLLRDEALTTVCATHEERDTADRCGVHAFRREVLRNHVVEDLDAWLARAVRRQGVPPRTAGGPLLVALRVDGAVVHRAVRAGAPLDRLRRISHLLAQRYDWVHADAATFVLNGAPPPVRTLNNDPVRLAPFGRIGTIRLTIDLSTTPGEVAAMYARCRESHGRIRRLGEKHTRLAVFAYVHADWPLDRQRENWNRKHRAWQYAFPSTFKRDADMALAALLELKPHRPTVARTRRS